ncbi:MAG TPA: His-Xaa-Ser system radical SAM maturase HxsC [Thermoanaerobaculia bacterium]|nr:His-Xaa-Ser system radical SAM maturase HxsC [Thermoanaerobaculia bacterium]
MRLHAKARVSNVERTLIGRVARTPIDDAAVRADAWRLGAIEDGYLGALSFDELHAPPLAMPVAHGITALDYLDDGDVVAVDPNGFVRTLYRRASRHNFILVTDQCNSYCLMCSQPPKAIDDFDRLDEHLRLVDLIDPATESLGITGGEPTLFGDGFLALIERCRDRLRSTALHVLTNGRMFFYRRFAAKLGALDHPNLVLGIPLYSDLDEQHDAVVQSRGAFEETVLGLLHLDEHGVNIELRVVLHRLTVARLASLAVFIARNFPFACHVALMGLEMFGLVHRNIGELWIDPADYQRELTDATNILLDAGMNVSIYNHQLCVLDEALRPLARKSISDWKNVYLPECNGCAVLDACGGFFASGVKRHSAAIRPLSSSP